MASRIFVLERCLWYLLIVAYIILFFFAYKEWSGQSTPYQEIQGSPFQDSRFNLSAVFEWKPLNLCVYYSSFSIGSQKFILNQLEPTIYQLSKRIDMEFVPYHNMTKKSEVRNKSLCGDDDIECTGNVYHSCMLKMLPNDVSIKTEMVGCLFGWIDFDKNEAIDKQTMVKQYQRCASNKRYYLNFKDVQKCANGSEGYHLLVENGYKTTQVQAMNIPLITIGGRQFSPNFQMSLRENLLMILCDILSNDPIGNEEAVKICYQPSTEPFKKELVELPSLD